MRRTVVSIVLVVLLAACSSGGAHLQPPPEEPVTSYFVDVKATHLQSGTPHPGTFTGFKRWQAGGDSKTLSFWSDDGDALLKTAATIRGTVLTVADYATMEHFHALPPEGYGGVTLRVGPAPADSIDAFLEHERKHLESLDFRVYTIRLLQDGVIAGRPVARVELVSNDLTHYYAIDRDAMFVLAYAIRHAGGGGLVLEATSIEYNPTLSEEDLRLDLEGMTEIPAPPPIFTPIPEP